MEFIVELIKYRGNVFLPPLHFSFVLASFIILSYLIFFRLLEKLCGKSNLHPSVSMN